MQTIHQLVAGFRNGDAISTAALLMRNVFRGWGCRSDILSGKGGIACDLRDEAWEIEEKISEFGPDDIAVLHFSIGNPINLIFKDLKCRKVIVYHNVTPSKYYIHLNRSTAADLDEGRRQLAMLADDVELSVAVSSYNASELIAAGYKNVKVLPLPIDIDNFVSGKRDQRVMRELAGNYYNVLFVGRCAPNKKIEDLATVTYYLTKIEPRARFIFVGAHTGMEPYYGLVKVHCVALGLENFLPMYSVTREELNACYASAHAFLCMSEHEGFCAPLIEAMLNKIPVLSLASAAIPETLDGAGVLFSTPPNFPLIAETIAEVLHNEKLRSEILARQEKRVEAIRSRNLDGEMREVFGSLIKF